MATQLSADALDKLKCTFVTEILNRMREETLGFVCTEYTEEELYTMLNYAYILQSTCDYDPCDIDAFAAKLSPVEVCVPTVVTNCTLILTILPNDTCTPFNLIRL